MMVDESSNLQRRFYNLVRDTFCAVYFIVAGLHVKRTNTNTNNKSINIKKKTHKKRNRKET